MAQDKVARVTIGKFGMPVDVKIKDETHNQYMLAFHEPDSGYEVFRHWYDKENVIIHNLGE
jgi:hypothetical protein